MIHNYDNFYEYECKSMAIITNTCTWKLSVSEFDHLHFANTYYSFANYGPIEYGNKDAYHRGQNVKIYYRIETHSAKFQNWCKLHCL